MYKPNTGTAADKRREDFAVVTAYGMNWKRSNMTCMHTHTHRNTL